MQQLSGILWLSVFFQALAVFLALRLIPLSKKALAWTALSAAFLLMTMRRTISLLHQEGYIKDSWFHAMSTEVVALVISVLMVVGIYLIRDIFVERIKNEDKLNTLIQAIDQSSVGIIVTDTHFNIEFLNQHIIKKFQFDNATWIGRNVDELDTKINAFCDVDGIVHTFSNLRLKAVDDAVDNVDIALNIPNGEVVWESLSISPVKENNSVTHYILVLEDITEKISQEKALEKLALYDPLTNLPNRKLFIDRLMQQIVVAKRDNESFAVFMLDLDRFKEVNDTLGHAVGDAMLKELGPRLQATLREGDTIARMGGDEFLILLPKVDEEQIKSMSGKIISALSRPVVVGDYALNIDASIGCSVFPHHGKDVKSLIKQADVAMYHAKRNHMDICIYRKNIDHNSMLKLGLVNDLRGAINSNQLYLKYQPKVELVSGNVVGVEALARWRHPTRGEISPSEFVPLAEQTGLVNSLTHWVLKTAIRQCEFWRRNGQKLNISVNLSAKDLHDPDLIPLLDELLVENRSCVDAITLELTESSIMTDVKSSLSILNQISERGIKLSIDDFGTGYSSLEYLARLPVDELKIDRSFVTKMHRNQNETVIVRSTIELAHNLGLHVIAEGVEEFETMNMLKALQCDAAQGFYLHEPQYADEITRSVEEVAI